MNYLEKILLAVMRTRKGYEQLRDVLGCKPIASVAMEVVKALDSYYKKYQHDTLQSDVFLMHMLQMTDGVKAEDHSVYEQLVISMLDTKVDGNTAREVIKQLHELDLHSKLVAMLQDYDMGKEIDLYESVSTSCSQYNKVLRDGTACNEVTDTIGDIIEASRNGTKFTWTNPALAEAMPDMRTGDQIIFAARPGIGKTSYLVYEVSRMCKSLPPGRPLVWLCNEGKGSKIKLTKARSVLMSTVDELTTLSPEMIEAALAKANCGNQFRIFNIHNRSIYDVERIIQETNPAIVVADMIDNIKGFSNAQRGDLRLEALYQWFRDCAVIYDFLALATSQTSKMAEGEAFPTQDMLKESSTAKQGACDAIIMMGKVNTTGQENIRYFSIAKPWKGQCLPGADPTARCEMTFDPSRALFSDCIQYQPRLKQHKKGCSDGI